LFAHACEPLRSVAQQPLTQLELLVQSELHTTPNPGFDTHIVGMPWVSAQHSEVVVHAPPTCTVHMPDEQFVHVP
jgi:hypothetical protein